LTSENCPTETNIVNAIINRPEKCYNELCSDRYNVFGFFLCFDDIPFLEQNIITENIFYQKTQHFNLPYFNLSKGVLYKATYDKTNNHFVSNGHCAKLGNLKFHRLHTASQIPEPLAAK
jgi:hypothetical protein